MDAGIPRVVNVAAAWAWRLLLIAALIALGWWLVTSLSTVTVPLMLAVLLTAALWPLKEGMVARRVPRALAVTLSLLLIAVLVVGIITLMGAQIASQWSELGTQAVNSFNQMLDWLATGPLKISGAQVDGWFEQAKEYVANQRSAIAGYIAAAGTQLGHFFAGIALALFATFYFLLDGPGMARSVSVLIPSLSRRRVMSAAGRGWTSLVSNVRAAVIVAAVDGLGALIGAAAVGSNMWLAIGAFTFLAAFVPLLGALVSGAVATGVVLVTLGWVRALIMLGVFIAVMEIEAHVLQPFLLGHAVSIHPLVVLYGIAVGMIVGGIVGALFVIPFLAFGNAFARSLSGVEHPVLPVPSPKRPLSRP
ncbi:MAG TPA: AI-2E family transporter [Propionibacteriaceae bacterium]|nr:AI-2E family transporter [Propionibacteriaceae bacterium]